MAESVFDFDYIALKYCVLDAGGLPATKHCDETAVVGAPRVHVARVAAAGHPAAAHVQRANDFDIMTS